MDAKEREVIIDDVRLSLRQMYTRLDEANHLVSNFKSKINEVVPKTR